jgi:hypothetical protein
MTNEETPIACTLATDAYRERLAWIARLNEDGLQSCRRRANILELRYKAAPIFEPFLTVAPDPE